MTIETYPGMNAKIVELLRWVKDNPVTLYAAQRIEELEAEAKRAQCCYDSLRIRFDATQRVLTRALKENQVRDECLKITLEALEWYGHNCPVLICGRAGETLEEIERRLAELEPEEKTNDNEKAP